MIGTRINSILSFNTKGIFIFAGISEFGEEIFVILEPVLKSNLFYYNCGNKFITDRFAKYFEDYNGAIIFVNGEECIIFCYCNDTGKFERKSHFKSMIPNKHKKGGQSSARFGHIADNIRDKYIITIIENINKLPLQNNWIFGSQDCINDVFAKKNEIVVSINNGGYLDFTNDTIDDTQKWISVLQNVSIDESKFQKICELIEIGDFKLEFDPACVNYLDQFEYIIITPQHPLYSTINLSSKIIKLPKNSKYYQNLHQFHCIGKYYYNNQDTHKNINNNSNNGDDFM
jgi:hypothetical protein